MNKTLKSFLIITGVLVTVVGCSYFGESFTTVFNGYQLDINNYVGHSFGDKEGTMLFHFSTSERAFLVYEDGSTFSYSMKIDERSINMYEKDNLKYELYAIDDEIIFFVDWNKYLRRYSE